ncbi:MAG TPA: MFS transporter [Acidimicrobiia bacterium]|nr:MFS transporter [Acidimicrobiia bacterium]
MSPMRDRRFALLVAGQAVNGIGSWCALIAMWGYAAYRFDASPAQIALVTLTWSLPPALFGFLGGVPVDRYGPRRVLVLADLAAAAIAVGMAFTTSLSQLLVGGLLLGFARVFAEPAFTALPPRLVPDDQLLRANAWMGAAHQIAIAIGPLVAAASIALFGLRAAFLIDAVTYLVGVAVVLPLAMGAAGIPTERVGVVAEVREGIEIVRARPDVLRLFLLGGSVYLVWGAYAVVEPLYVRDVLGRSETTFALLQSVFGIALVTNGLLVPRIGERVARLGTVRLAALASGLAAILYLGTDNLVVAALGVGVWGGATAWFVVPQRTLVQRATPMSAHGRVLAIDSALRSWGHVIAMPLTALLVELGGVRLGAFAFAAIPVALALWLRTRPAPSPRVSAAEPVTSRS